MIRTFPVVTQIESLKGRHVIARASLNVPVTDGQVANAYRIMRALPTLRYLHQAGARTIVIAHIGRDPKQTLRPVADVLEKHLPVQWGGVIGSEECLQRRELMADGDVLLLENTRADEREKHDDGTYAQEIAALGDVFVNDAFAAAHRSHASTTGVMNLLPSYLGLQFMQEIQQLDAAMQPQSPSLFMLGGAKFETKIPLVEAYLDTYSHTFIGGALANDVLKARGFEVGQSLLSDTDLSAVSWLQHERLLLPVDVVVTGPHGDRICAVDDVQTEEKIYDAGPQTVAMLRSHISTAHTVLWNGPFGNYEVGYTQATEATAKLVADSEAVSIVGGGDTVAAIETLGLNDQFTHVSTGGGAMLAYLQERSLPVLNELTR